MSLTPSSKAQARAMARMVEHERNDNTWWKQPAYYEPLELELQQLARRLNREFLAHWQEHPKKHASRYVYRRQAKQWRKQKAA